MCSSFCHSHGYLGVRTGCSDNKLLLQELTQFVESARQRMIDQRNKDLDEYDGLSPDEINALESKKKS